MPRINELNWTFCQYVHDNCRVLIHMGGELDVNEQYLELYYVNVLKNDDTSLDSSIPLELEQVAFSELSLALDYINKNFAHWKFDNQLEQKKDPGGCGSCVAH